ncbi:MAG TPA: response regulator, partial [bacterium]|nr:response regulator [bacterium]
REMSDRLRHAEVLEANYQFASGLAHDTSNLLTGVLGNMDLTAEKLKRGEPAEDEMHHVRTDIERMAEMIRHFRNQAQGGSESFTMLNLAPIIKQVMRTGKQLYPSKIEFKEPVLPRPPYVMGNAHQIFRALLNVISNGAQAIIQEAAGKEGSIEIKMERVHLEQPVGMISPNETFRPGTYIKIAVKNSGFIHPDVFHQMMDVLRGKKKSDFTTKSRGSGQGLKVIRQVVIENHGGIVDLKNDRNEGTTFFVYFWAPNGISKKAGAMGKSQEIENIWVIHDNGTVQSGIREQLTREGYQVLLFDQARTALDFAKESPLQKPLLIIYKEEEERRMTDALKILQDLFPGRPLQVVAVPNLLNRTGSWPKRPNADMDNFFENIGDKLRAGKKKTAVMAVGELQKKITEKESPAEPTTEKKLNILIVDDEEYVAKLLLRISKPFAAKKNWVTSGIEAVSEIEKEFYDIVFLDLTFVGGSALETAEKIREKWGSETKIFITSGTMIESNSPLLAIIDGRIDKPFKASDVADFLKKLAQQIADEKKIEERSEIRQLMNQEKGLEITDSMKAVTLRYRQNILPLRLELLGPQVLAALLEEILGRPVYAEKAGIVPLNHEAFLPDQGRIVATQGFQSWLRQTVESPSFSEAGRAIFDSSWLDRFLEEPRSLYLLLKALKRSKDHASLNEPFLGFVGDPLLIQKNILRALRRQKNGLTAEEKIDVGRLLTQFNQFIGVLLPEQVGGYVQSHDNGVAILRAQHSLLSVIPRAAHFILEPEEINRRDIPAVVLTLPALLKAAALIRGVPPD